MNNRDIVYGPGDNNYGRDAKPVLMDIRKFNIPPKEEDWVIVFVRIKKEGHCFKANLRSKRHTILWVDEITKSAVIKMQKCFYECDHNWLIKHRLLSCYTEMQLIRLKP